MQNTVGAAGGGGKGVVQIPKHLSWHYEFFYGTEEQNTGNLLPQAPSPPVVQGRLDLTHSHFFSLSVPNSCIFQGRGWGGKLYLLWVSPLTQTLCILKHALTRDNCSASEVLPLKRWCTRQTQKQTGLGIFQCKFFHWRITICWKWNFTTFTATVWKNFK